MAQAEFYFDPEFNHFLALDRCNGAFEFAFQDRPSVKDAIESLGVPHPEVDVILVNGRSVDFSYLLQDGDRLEVYPILRSPDVTPRLHLCPGKPDPLGFVLDVHLGKLASSLRMLGFDTLYRNHCDDAELAEISATQNRILLTRDRGLLMRSIVRYGYSVRSTNSDRQLSEILERFDLLGEVQPFRRCLRCNGLLHPVDKETIVDQIPAQTQQHINEFHRCQDCLQIYWRGAHYQRMQQFITDLLTP
ncbi:Mut7-C ubiquitin/RNAse domain-containing protein [Desertifilum sp. FACHB-1129]|uniref:Twitching motility protein PilT n=2 Tax=Desertifilum tharense IPPAS B-1220 TaxID=1781255 RepID=A0A1E5QF84_9CYAN|nr:MULTISPECIES: Mut7-C RNAse domain-containing protein [Desertifilum]MDA0211710.1 MoaD/ThiS family protein [Cyanobacteria bacterium FC1]MBD2311940.1 Mut7-C ubiquitin/RNAse domain-containing protein [Desertifilum sp. FACHB-1129]MBD2322392.1 Mut7-C ubiquitin/RNAse domain-containing protein [Desertifilum sp. FACHB-866]MBD2332555.1 Mut7-C ubiquitin/RNAse domain-containing protein [Desertifilum sp. FACHB-868]OEJ73257.1 twitching motility protein PilT [Desertifilum tharense IPPAS B-1220]